MKNEETVCAVVVTYNRKNLLIECLEALQKQIRPIQAIYLIDNASTDNTPELLLKKGYIKELPSQHLNESWEKEFSISNLTDKNFIKLHYVRMNENTGGAGGFYEGVKRGYERGYDWLWLMDDDAEAYKDSLESLESYFLDKNIVALASSVIKPNKEIDLNHRGMTNFNHIFPLIQKPLDIESYAKNSIEIDTASFVGLLIKKQGIKKIGYPKKEYFIHNDDIEYCLRLNSIGKILLVPDSKIKHKEAAVVAKRIPVETLWLKYYGRRNQISIGKTYSTNKFLFYIEIAKNLVKSIGGIILYDDYKIKRIKFLLMQVIDGLNDTFDNEKPKKLLK